MYVHTYAVHVRACVMRQHGQVCEAFSSNSKAQIARFPGCPGAIIVHLNFTHIVSALPVILKGGLGCSPREQAQLSMSHMMGGTSGIQMVNCEKWYSLLQSTTPEVDAPAFGMAVSIQELKALLCVRVDMCI